MVAGRTVLAAAILLAAAVTAPAAAKTQHTGHTPGQQVRAPAPVTSGYINSESPELTGGGSLGHNQMKGW